MFIGVDTHKQAHVLVALDEQGRTVGTRTIANTPDGWGTALRWAHAWPAPHVWGVENSGALGKGFAQFLLAQDEGRVHEVSAHRTAQYRRRGRSQDKTDAADALAMARLLRAEADDLPSVQPDDVSTELRLLSEHRDHLVAERTRLVNRLHAEMLQIDPAYKAKSGALTSAAGVRYCRQLEVPQADRVVQVRLLVARRLADRILALDAEIREMTDALTERVRETGTPLLQLCGVGAVMAARLLGELGCRPRIRSAAALAALAGIAPVAVSSAGKRGHRVNHGGNRQLNRAIHVMALSQLRCEPRARTYYDKKRAEGKTARAAMRCLKRRLVDVLFRHWHAPVEVAPGTTSIAA